MFKAIYRFMVKSTHTAEPMMILAGIFGFIGFPFYYMVWHYLYPQPYESLALRLSASLLCLGLALKNKWPAFLRPFLVFYWYIIIIYGLPFFFTYISLRNQFNLVSLMADMAGLFLLIYLENWLNIIIMIIIGSGLAFLVYYLQTPTVDFANQLNGSYAFVILFVLAIVIVFAKGKDTAEKRKLKVMASIGSVTSQVAHDIRSPIAAILMLVKSSPELPEDRRILLREAATRIQDIANNILEQHRSISQTKVEEKSLNASEVLVSAAIDMVLAEKKVQSQLQRIEFVAKYNHAAYFAFIHIDFTAFKSMVSNLINNAAEAMNHRGMITLLVEATGSAVTIIIRDQGKGMPATLIAKIKNAEAVTEGKAEGHGLGLSHALATINKFNGHFDIQSTQNVGADIILEFPQLPNPIWMANLIELKPHDTIIILDDDNSIHGAWDQRFKEIVQSETSLEIKHFEQADAAIDFIKQFERKNRLLLLTDYELLNQRKNGLDVIAETKLRRSILVTSHYTNQDILDRAIELNTKVLPKLLASEIDIQLLKPALTLVRKLYDLVLIDDDNLVINTWKMHAEDAGKKLLSFRSPEEFFKAAEGIDELTPIYVDSSLGNGVKGEEIAKQIYDLGFNTIYLATGYSKAWFNAPMPWIKEIVGKEAPF